PEDRNLISGNTSFGINLSSTNNIVNNNYIGINAAGTTPLGNNGPGIMVLSADASNNVIGGSFPLEGNVIGGNTGAGIRLEAVSQQINRTVIQGNFIGVGADGSANVGNGGDGITTVNGDVVNSFIGGINPGEANFIANNANNGVRVNGATAIGNTISGNSIFNNTLKGIALTGGNNNQTAPSLTNARYTNRFGVFSGTLNSNPSRAYRVEFFANDACDSSEFGEGRRFLGELMVITNSSGVATFNAAIALRTAINASNVITATATDTTTGDTSEFSICQPSAVANTITVTNTNDSGAGSLRQAITDANATTDADVIRFNIPGTGVQTISPTSVLPQITQPVIIDGYTQSGAARNTQQVGSNANLLVVLSGANIAGGTPGLILSSPG
ncbi:MAG: hypothetical protein ACRDRT_13670, partial [Pseudonocardiaceae bacterium]